MIERLAWIGFIGQALTGWWAFDIQWAFTLFVLMVLPLCVKVCVSCYRMGVGK